MELGLCQKGTATQIGVSEDTLRDWELGRQDPRAKNIPEIIRFLGYDPGLPRQNVAELIASERKRRGLSIAQLAAQIGVSNDTLRNWEAGRCLPAERSYAKLSEFVR